MFISLQWKIFCIQIDYSNALSVADQSVSIICTIENCGSFFRSFRFTKETKQFFRYNKYSTSNVRCVQYGSNPRFQKMTESSRSLFELVIKKLCNRIWIMWNEIIIIFIIIIESGECSWSICQKFDEYSIMNIRINRVSLVISRNANRWNFCCGIVMRQVIYLQLKRNQVETRERKCEQNAPKRCYLKHKDEAAAAAAAAK